MRQRGDVLRGLTPERLKAQHEAFYSGNLRPFSATQEQIIRKDDLLPGVVGKRTRAPCVLGYEILTTENSDRAEQHRTVLTHLYNNLKCTNVVDQNERGGVALLLRQMMSAVGFRYAAHEVLWKISPDGITAELRFAPLYFFENTSGRLRFLPSDSEFYGLDLDPGRWLITVGEGLMVACSIAYLFKHYPLRDWLIYCGRHGMPGICGETTAAPGSQEWKAMESAVADFAAEFAAVYSTGDSINKIDLTAQGELPYPKLIERMDRMMASLWRGADLSTMSSGTGTHGSGASLQGSEAEILEASDAMMLSEALNEYLDTWAIRYYLGDEEPLAYIQMKTSTRKNVEQDLKVDLELHEMGFPLSLRSISERYNRPLPKPGDSLLPMLETGHLNHGRAGDAP